MPQTPKICSTCGPANFLFTRTALCSKYCKKGGQWKVFATSDVEKAGNVHRFLGYAVAAAKNRFVSEEHSDFSFDYDIHEAILNAMTCPQDKIIQQVLQHGADESYYPKFIHLKGRMPES